MCQHNAFPVVKVKDNGKKALRGIILRDEIVRVCITRACLGQCFLGWFLHTRTSNSFAWGSAGILGAVGKMLRWTEDHTGGRPLTYAH